MESAKKQDDHKTAITSFLTKLRKNRENVPAELLKTKYAAAYGQLCENIKAELRAMVVDDLPRIRIREDLLADAAGVISMAYASGGHPRLLGQAAFKDMDPEKTVEAAGRAAADIEAALRKFLEEHANPDRPAFKEV